MQDSKSGVDCSKTMIVILGDQLSHELECLRQADPKTSLILMAEVIGEASYVRHHKKKIAFIFSAMRHFADELRGEGWHVHYVNLDEPENTGTLTSEVSRAAEEYRPGKVVVTEPGEWRLSQDSRGLIF